jgi:hypothetical protein
MKRANYNTEQKKEEPQRTCYRCSNKFPHSKGTQSPALGKDCKKCGKLDHFARACKGIQSKASNYSYKDKIQTIDNMNEDKDYLFSIQTDSRMPLDELDINSKTLCFKIDTDATINVLDEQSYRKLHPKPKLVPHITPAFAYYSETPLQIIGKFTTAIHYNNITKDTEFVVIKADGGNLIRFLDSRNLGLIEILNPICNSSQIFRSLKHIILQLSLVKLEN